MYAPIGLTIAFIVIAWIGSAEDRYVRAGAVSAILAGSATTASALSWLVWALLP